MAKAPSQADLIFEIGTEELPARFLPLARGQLVGLARKFLAEERLAHGDCRAFATPRRLILDVRKLAPVQESREIVILGPLQAQCFDEKGEPTPAALGFARKHGTTVQKLKERKTDKGIRMAHVAVERGKPAGKVLPDVLGKLVAGLEFPKSMRWPQSPATFARPIRWLAALLGSQPVRLQAAGLRAGKATRGQRFRHPRPLKLKSAADYWKTMRRAGIVVDEEERRRIIKTRADALARKARGRVIWDEGLLAEVANLVEVPLPVLGAFPREALDLPREVLVASMREHQRYFAVGDDSGNLLPLFVAVANGVGTKAAVTGNERVLKARLADARYCFAEDRKERLEEYAQRLGGVVWQARAGSLKDKCQRVQKLAGQIAGELKLDPEAAARAAALSKADLLTKMVGEIPSLQGVIGGIYARLDGESAEVAEAIKEHYRPMSQADSVPGTEIGCVVALADKLDTLVGHLGLGHNPSGTADPYALRRCAIGILRILWERDWRLALTHLLRRALAGYASQEIALSDAAAIKTGRDFLRGRLEGVFAEQNFPHDAVQASLVGFEADQDIPVMAAKRLMAISSLRRRLGFRETVFAFSRVTNILPRTLEESEVEPELLIPPERELYDSFEKIRPQAEELAARCEFEKVYDLLSGIRPVINGFFESVLVMDEDLKVRERRLKLLKRVEKTIRLFADVTKLVIA